MAPAQRHITSKGSGQGIQRDSVCATRAGERALPARSHCRSTFRPVVCVRRAQSAASRECRACRAAQRPLMGQSAPSTSYVLCVWGGGGGGGAGNVLGLRRGLLPVRDPISRGRGKRQHNGSEAMKMRRGRAAAGAGGTTPQPCAPTTMCLTIGEARLRRVVTHATIAPRAPS